VKKRFFSFLQITVTIFFVWYTFSKINLIQLKNIINDLNINFLFFSVITYFFSQYISSLRLHFILNNNNLNITKALNFQFYLIGMFYNFFIPGGIGGDAYKGYLMNKRFKWSIKNIIKLLFIDRFIGLVMLISILIFVENGLLLNLNILIRFIFFTLLIFVGYIITKKLTSNNSLFFKAYAYSALIQLTQFLSLIFILLSLGIIKNFIEIIFIFLISSILSIFSFGGIGIREYVFLTAASTIDISPELSTSIGLLFTVCAGISSAPGIIYLKNK
jgi:uncharacterized membrane protein YbhN (UPF0104 family)